MDIEPTKRTLRRTPWLAVALGGAVWAAQVVAVDSDSMQLMDDRNQSLASNIALRNPAAAREDAARLSAMFADVEAFYVQKGHADDAVEWSRQSRGLAEEISREIGASDFDHAATTAVVLSKTCKSCHEVYNADNN